MHGQFEIHFAVGVIVCIVHLFTASLQRRGILVDNLLVITRAPVALPVGNGSGQKDSVRCNNRDP